MVTDELKIILSVTGQTQAVNRINKVNQSVVKLDNGIVSLHRVLQSSFLPE